MTKKVRPKILCLLSFTATLALVLGQAAEASADDTKADVVVYGATPGGVCAAIGAAREGVSVILLEPTDHVGGLNTGGLSHSDSNQCDRRTVMGLFDEWHTRIEKDYESRGIELPYQVSVKDHAVWTYEPHVAARVTKQMLREAKVQVFTRRYLQTVRKDGTRITDIVTTDGTFKAEVFIDATYEGDLMAASGVSWTIGREGRAEFGESYAGKQYPKSKMNINGFGREGKRLPLITTTDAGHEEAGDKNVMVYSFRLCLTEDPENRVPFPEPANYDPARFEIMRRYAKAGGRLGFDLYRLPGNKFDGNNSIGGQFSLGLIGGGNGWCEADEAGRAAIWEAHKQYTLELYHFLTNDPTVPKEVQRKYARLGLCKDEFANYGHFSPALYVREGRRMRGMYVLSQKDILMEPEKDDPIVISSFPIDSHDCQRVALKDGHVINEGTIFPVRKKNPKQGYAYHVPYRSVLPKPEECTNLLVPVALSCTHVGISSIRVEPTWMILGQSAGIAAALAAKNEQRPTVQQLPYPKLRERLLAQGQVLDLPRQTLADVPDQLPDPDGRAADQNKPVKVFILMGQSNMLGFGRVAPEEQKGTLRYLIEKDGKYPHLVDDEGNWTQRMDVRYVQLMHRNGNMSTLRNEWLTVKGNHIGPELQFGHIMGHALDEPVLVLKSCIGNRSLGWDLLPPGSKRFEFENKVYAGYKESPLSWDKATEPKPINWYAGKQYDDDVADAKKILADLAKYYPEYKGQGYEVTGFVWWQGHKDQNAAHASRYEQNLVHLIKTLRKDFDAPEAKFVLATIAFDGEKLDGHGLTIANAQLTVSGEKGKYPEFKGNVWAIDARPFWRDKSVSPSGAGYHYNHNAETYMEVGGALGRAMAKLLSGQH